MLVAARMEQKLKEGLSPVRLHIIDESARHLGHAGHHPEGESHFRVEIVSAAFTGLGRLDRHRMVNSLLAEELRERVHALSLSALTPDEAEAVG